MRDSFNNLLPQRVLNPAVYTADSTGESIDLQEADSVLVCIQNGPYGDAITGINILYIVLEHSDDNTNWSFVELSDVLNDGTAVGSGVVHRFPQGNAGVGQSIITIGYIGNKRYLRASLDARGTHSNGTGVSVAFLLGRTPRRPVY